MVAVPLAVCTLVTRIYTRIEYNTTTFTITNTLKDNENSRIVILTQKFRVRLSFDISGHCHMPAATTNQSQSLQIMK